VELKMTNTSQDQVQGSAADASQSVSTALKYPLTKKALGVAFAALNPQSIRVYKTSGFHEAVIDGEWSLTRIKAHLKALGYFQTGKKDALLFVNESKTVGFQLQGISPHPDPKKNTWRTYNIEVQARPASLAKKQDSRTVALFNL
jgi:hypothetical protein